MDIRNGSISRDAGHEFVAQAEAFLAQALGRPGDLKELSEFVETAGASMLGSMFSILRSQEGKEKSEAWLKKAMGNLSGAVRLHGADALVKCEISVKDMPNRLARREELRAPEAPPTPHAPAQVPEEELESCKCKTAEDGSCAPCFRSLSGFLGGTFKAMVDMAKAGKAAEGVCGVCKVKHGDEALSRIVPEILKSFEVVEKEMETRIEKASTFIVQLGLSLGIRELPLTHQALMEHAKSS
jgi:hypothetical protein